MRQPLFVAIVVFLLGTFHSPSVFAGMDEMHEFNLERVPELQKTVDSYVEKIKAPDNIHADKMKPLAE